MTQWFKLRFAAIIWAYLLKFPRCDCFSHVQCEEYKQSDWKKIKVIKGVYNTVQLGSNVVRKLDSFCDNPSHPHLSWNCVSHLFIYLFWEIRSLPKSAMRRLLQLSQKAVFEHTKDCSWLALPWLHLRERKYVSKPLGGRILHSSLKNKTGRLKTVNM